MLLVDTLTFSSVMSSGKVLLLVQWIPHIYVGDPAPPPRPTPRGQLHSKLGEGGGDDCGILKQ